VFYFNKPVKVRYRFTPSNHPGRFTEDSKNPTYLELAELHRQLGADVQSRAAMVRAGKNAEKLGQVIGLLLDLGTRGPARYRIN